MLIRNVYVSREYTKNLQNDFNQQQIKSVYIDKGQLSIIQPDEFSKIKNMGCQLKTRWHDSMDAITQVIDADANYIVLPGLFDTHVHGQGGYDFSDIREDPTRLIIILSALAKTGIAYVMPTFFSMPINELKTCLQVINEHIKRRASSTPTLATILGIHLEGPFIAKNCAGAHDVTVLKDHIDLNIFKEIISAAPNVIHWKITLSPDLPGALQFIKQAKHLENDGIFVKVFIGHSNAAKEIINDAIMAGAVGFTHLGNACQESAARVIRPLTKQDIHSHLVQWVMDNASHCPPGVELIVDGVHLSSSFVNLIKNTIGNKIVLVTDSLGPTGNVDGIYSFGNKKIRKEGHQFYLINETDQYKLAGSATTLPYCLEQYVSWTTKHENLEERLRTIYMAAVLQPRFSSLSLKAINQLPDDKNFVVINHHTGQLSLSFYHGMMNSHSCSSLHSLLP